MLQRHMRVRERHRDSARDVALAVTILADQRASRVTVCCHARGECHAHKSARRQADAIAERRDRVEHGARRARQRPAIERNRIRRRSAAANELRTIGFPFHRATQPALDAEHVKCPETLLLGGARAVC